MNMTRLFLTLSVVILTGITGCDSDSSTKTVAQITKTGVFIDNEVAGISYNTETQSGVTGPGGEYQYISGETITFSVGGISLPTALAQAILTPLGLVGTADTNNTTVLNIVKLLLSVDEDGDSSNGIQVSERAHAFAAGMSVDFNSSSFDSDVAELVANSGSVNTELIDDATAMAHLEATIASIETAPDIFTHQWLSAKTLYSVRYNTSDNVSVVKQLEFNVGATTISETGLLNSNANEVIAVLVSDNGLLHETNNPIQGRKIVCDSSDQYVKTHVIANGLFNTVDLLFFDETQALEFADTLTVDIPPCSFEINTTENRAPVANKDSVTVNEDTEINLAVLENDYDEDGDTINFDSASATNGTVTIEPDKTLTYTPTLNFNGSDNISYDISDGQGGTASSTVAITITPINDAPLAIADSGSTSEDTTININVLANDSDTDNDTLSISSASASNGVVSIASDNSLNYTPNSNFNGSDTINYSLSDGLATVTSTVAVSISSVNDNPVAVADIASTNEDALVSISVLSNDSDSDGDTLTIISASAVNGTAVINGNNIDYTPNANFNGTDTISYTVNDTANPVGAASSTVTVSITAINDNPVAVSDTASTSEDTLANINVLANDSDADGDTLSIDSASATNGTVTIEPDNTLNYTPTLNFNGSDNISYNISDGQGGAASSTIAMTITSVNDAPLANSDDATINEDSLGNINILSNDTDLEDDTLTVTVVTASNGDVSINPDQTLDYLPNSNFNGTDTINYTISDGTLTSDSAVNLIITAVNDAPIISPVSTSIAENSANATALVTMTGSDVDTGDILTYSIVSNSDFIFGIDSNSGQLSIADNISLNYESAVRHEVVVKVEDSGGLSNSAIATVDVTNVVENVTPTLDATFGTSGTAGSNAFATGHFDQPRASVIDASGKLVVVGKNDWSGPSTDIFIARFNTDGTLDRSFGHQGVVNQDLEAEEKAVAVAIDSAGRIVVTGTWILGGSQEVFVARFTPTGELDTSFNTTGYRITTYGVPMIAVDLKITVDDSILVASSVNPDGFRLLKFDSDGTYRGYASADFNGGPDIATDMVLQSDGKVVITGTVFNEPMGNDFAAARFNVLPGLELDTTYNGDGKATLDLGNSDDDISFGAHINSNDEIIMVGSTIPSGGKRADMAALKIDSNGDLISGFGTSGLLVVDIDGDGDDTSNQSIGKAVTSDASGNLYFAIDKGTSNVDTVIYKTDANGSPVSGYGTAGQVTFDHNSDENIAEALLIDSSDRAVLLTTTIMNGEPDVVVARFTTAGVLDTSFDTDGINILDPTFSNDTLNELIELTVAPHAGKFVAVGTSSSDYGAKLIVARYNADGSQDDTFGSNGYYVHTAPEATIIGHDIVELSNGKLVAVGAYDARGLVLMLKNDGTLDTSFATTGEKKLTGENGDLLLNVVAIDNSNKIVVSGTGNQVSNDLYMARMDLTGTLDNTFATDGIALIYMGNHIAIEDIAVLSDNAIIAVGQRGNNGLVAQITSTGTLDTTGFAPNDGYVTLDSGTNVDVLKRVKVKSDGKIVAAGYSTATEPSNLLVQLNSNGTLDTTFDSDGIVSHNYGSGSAQTLALALDASDNILITGYNSNGSNDDIFVARVTAAGATDNLFNNTGGILFDYTENEAATAILVRSDGTLVIAGADNLNLFPSNFFFLQKFNLVEP